MYESKWKDICSCDVKDKELLARFREKLKLWKSCLSDEKDYHSIYNQLITLFWDHAVYRTLNEARRLSEETNDPSTGLQGTIIDLLDRNFMDSQAIAIRRLTDRDKKVNSLRRLMDEIKQSINLYTRENYVCYDGISYDENPSDDNHVRYARNARQTQYDLLSGKNRDERNRDDIISSTILKDVEEKIEKDFQIMKDVRTYVNNWVAHAAAPCNRGKHVEVLNEISLKKLEDCYQAIIRIGKKIELLIDEFLLCSVPTPQFDQLKNWDKPIVTTKDLDNLREYWWERVKEIESWSKSYSLR